MTQVSQSKQGPSVKLDFSSENKINPIKNSVIQESGLEVLVKRMRSRTWRYSPDKKYDPKALKRVVSGLRSQRKVTKLLVKDSRKSYGFKNLNEILRNLTCLREISLEFHEADQFSNLTLDNLRKRLQKLVYLQHLSLKISWCGYVTPSGFSYFLQDIQKMTSLTTLSLNFEGCDWISDAGIDDFRKSLQKLTCLKKLSLDLGLNNVWNANFNMTYIVANSLREGFENLVSLKYLSLNFRRCSKFTDAELDRLKRGFHRLTSLKHFSLCFHSSSQITDSGIENFKEGLQRLTALTEISLKIPSKITDIGLNFLRQTFQKLPVLTQLSLDVSGCEKITSHGLDNLRQELQKLSSLHCLEIIAPKDS